MSKRILLTFLALLSVYSLCAAVYRVYEPDNVRTENGNSAYISYNALREYILSQDPDASSFLFFYSSDNDDCVYVKNTVMHTVEKETGIDPDSVIATVDITSLEQSLTASRITAEWGVHSWPAFICVTADGQNITVTGILEWNSASPMTASDIERWLSECGYPLAVS